MKKIILSFLAMLLPLMASAIDINGINYSTSGTTATVISNLNSPYTGNITIPSKISYLEEEYTVTGIGNEAFKGCTGLTSVSIPSTVTNIGNYAFMECTGLTSINLSNVKSIGNGAFKGCTILTSVDLSSVTSISEMTFQDCSGLTSIYLGKVTYFGESAFEKCVSLESVHISDLSTWCCAFFYDPSSNPLLYGTGQLYLNDKEINDLVIPNDVTYIGEHAFISCSSLTSIKIGNVTSIGASAFESCTEVTSLTINSVNKICHNTFKACISLESINIGSVKYIEGAAFQSCGKLTSIKLGGSIEHIGEQYTFQGCENLKSVYITDLSAWCSARFDDYYSNPLRYAEHLYFNDKEIIDLVVPDDVTSVGKHAFAYFKGLTSVTFSNSVTTIGMEAFMQCFNLTSVSIPKSVTTIDDYAFSHCPLKTLIIPNSVTSIGEGAFNYTSQLSSIIVESGNPNYDSRNNCNALIESGTNKLLRGCKNTIIPDDVTSIEKCAFVGCDDLTSIFIPKSVTNIGEDPFGMCGDLAFIKVDSENPNYDSRDNCNAIIESKSNTLLVGCMNTVIPNNITIIGYMAFGGPFSLTSIVIPKSVDVIGGSAFLCTNLTTICCLKDVPPRCFRNESFSNVDKERCVVWVPKGSVEAYKEDTGWKDFTNIREIIYGDVNLDGKLDKDDQNTIVSYIMGKTPEVFYVELADMNGDEEVNAADIVLLINKTNGQALLGETAFYLIGDHNGWDMTDKTYAFTKLADGKTWEITIPSEGAGCFKIAPGSTYDHQDVSFWSYLLCAEYDQYTGLHGIMQQGDIMAAWLLNTEGATSYTIRIVPSEMTYQIIPN